VTLTPTELADYETAQAALRPFPGVSLAVAANEFAEARKILEGTGLDLRSAARAAKSEIEARKDLPAIAVGRLVDEFLESRAKQNASTRYIQDCRSRLKRFAEAFACGIASVHANEITAWLEKQDVAGRTRNNTRTVLVTLFAYARRKGYLPRGKQTEAELVEAVRDPGGEIGIYTPDQLRTILAKLPGSFVPGVVLGAFAGLRTEEIVRLEWKEVDLQGGHITIKAAKSKTASRRIVPVLPVLRAWLGPHAKKDGPVIAYSGAGTYTRALFQAIRETGIHPVHNGLRHSYASYRLALIKAAPQVALEMGNSPQKLFSNYRELVVEKAAKAWFGTRPTPRNVFDFDPTVVA
jgi:integrase